jgi:molybdopterin-guanine dinucleotide biosynthesis protein A
MTAFQASAISAYILAGGLSSRMGTDKAMLTLAGRRLIAHAVAKARRLTGGAHILSSRAELAGDGPLVPDLHPGTGPIGGIEAALRHSVSDWNLILPVDLPFVPAGFLEPWMRGIAAQRPVRVAMFRVFDRSQPTLLMIHRDAAPWLTAAIERGEYRLRTALDEAARGLAGPGAPVWQTVPYVLPIDENVVPAAGYGPAGAAAWRTLTPAQVENWAEWFANLNTPKDFARAEGRIAALDALDER